MSDASLRSKRLRNFARTYIIKYKSPSGIKRTFQTTGEHEQVAVDKFNKVMPKDCDIIWPVIVADD